MELSFLFEQPFLGILITNVVIFFVTFVVYRVFYSKEDKGQVGDDDEDEGEAIEPRNWTVEQLREFDGSDETKPIYIGAIGEVFDVTEGKNFYGKDGPYNVFAGRDATRAFAKFSTDEKDVADPRTDDLTSVEWDQAHDWVEKFRVWKGYPVVGKVLKPESNLSLTKEALQQRMGEIKQKIVPYGANPDAYNKRVHWPLLVGAGGKIFDMSFGGYEFYSEGKSYHFLVGHDASRALAKMSFDRTELDGSVSDLSETEQKTLSDWVQKFEQKKLYPVVGTVTDYDG